MINFHIFGSREFLLDYFREVARSQNIKSCCSHRVLNFFHKVGERLKKDGRSCSFIAFVKHFKLLASRHRLCHTHRCSINKESHGCFVEVKHWRKKSVVIFILRLFFWLFLCFNFVCIFCVGGKTSWKSWAAQSEPDISSRKMNKIINRTEMMFKIWQRFGAEQSEC